MKGFARLEVVRDAYGRNQGYFCGGRLCYWVEVLELCDQVDGGETGRSYRVAEYLPEGRKSQLRLLEVGDVITAQLDVFVVGFDSVEVNLDLIVRYPERLSARNAAKQSAQSA